MYKSINFSTFYSTKHSLSPQHILPKFRGDKYIKVIVNCIHEFKLTIKEIKEKKNLLLFNLNPKICQPIPLRSFRKEMRLPTQQQIHTTLKKKKQHSEDYFINLFFHSQQTWLVCCHPTCAAEQVLAPTTSALNSDARELFKRKKSSLQMSTQL